MSKWQNKQLSAYTLVELIVVLLLSSLLCTAVFGMYFWMINRYHDFESKRYNSEQVLGLTAEMERLFFEAETIALGRGNQLIFQLPRQEILMQFDDDYVLRQWALEIDTIQVAASLQSVYELEGVGGRGLVQTATITIMLGGEEINRMFIKQYDARRLLPQAF
jgi:Tfp pilus assembly protein PilE